MEVANLSSITSGGVGAGAGVGAGGGAGAGVGLGAGAGSAQLLKIRALANAIVKVMNNIFLILVPPSFKHQF
jgi:hypothetical protein